MHPPSSRYFLARPSGVWHLILHGLTRFLPRFARRSTPVAEDGRADRLPADAQSTDGGPLNITPWYLAALAPFAAIGYSGAYLGHAAVVVLTMGIFFGTLSLGRAPRPSSPQPPARLG